MYIHKYQGIYLFHALQTFSCAYVNESYGLKYLLVHIFFFKFTTFKANYVPEVGTSQPRRRIYLSSFSMSFIDVLICKLSNSVSENPPFMRKRGS